MSWFKNEIEGAVRPAAPPMFNPKEIITNSYYCEYFLSQHANSIPNPAIIILLETLDEIRNIVPYCENIHAGTQWDLSEMVKTHLPKLFQEYFKALSLHNGSDDDIEEQLIENTIVVFKKIQEISQTVQENSEYEFSAQSLFIKSKFGSEGRL